ncbi:hypothetical protein [Lishizhenia sp.]|uniref:hypothetical protein n=1 Tax=Lishizhenia sp. TaxID=2497594 RepID=UPI00299D4D34|nr:hypothetical protein [Lishizhenia sp.]MDX1447229.1 hypothetical protein [Lishizhenia sp.]
MKYLLFISLLFIFSACIKEPDCEPTNPEGVNYKGCGNFSVFEPFDEGSVQNAIIHIHVDVEAFALTDEYQNFSLTEHPEILAQITSYNKSTMHGNLCTDGLDADLIATNVWTATEGDINMRIARPKSECDDTYVVDVLLNDAKFIDDNGNEILVSKVEFLHRMVNYPIG